MLAINGFCVCSGGYGGVMAAVSRGAKEGGGKTYGVTAQFFSARANSWIDEEVRVATWQERLFELIRMAHGFVACRGGSRKLVGRGGGLGGLNKKGVMGKTLAVVRKILSPGVGY